MPLLPASRDFKASFVTTPSAQLLSLSLPLVFYSLQLLQAFVSVCTKLGKRKKQEDRATTVPRVHGREDLMFLGIFDGTVGDYAADTIHLTIADYMLNSKVRKENSAV